MKSGNSRSRKGAWTIAVMIVSILAWSGISVEAAMVEKTWEVDAAKKRTQAGARVNFSTFKDWNLKAENLSARGHNPLYYPLKPGFRYVMEYPNHPWGYLRIEVKVLDQTEKFDLPGFGKFECAVVQEEEFYDGIYDQQALNWFCIDKTNLAMYAFGETSWEIDQIGRKVFAGTWRVGEPDGGGKDSPNADPGLLMPADFQVGARYIFDGQEAEAYGYTENMETGLTVTVPAGTFKDCVRAREYSLTNPSDVTDKWYCKGVGIVKDTSDGELIASDAVPGTDMSSFGMYHRNPKQPKAPVAKVTGPQATEIALKEMPGAKATSLKIERLGKYNVYAIEVVDKDDVEWDVFVDIETGKVIGKER